MISEAFAGRIWRTIRRRGKHGQSRSFRHSGWKWEFAATDEDKYVSFALQTYLERYSDIKETLSLIAAISDPASVTPRITERLSLSRASLRVESSRVIHRRLVDQRLITPVLRASKGQLIEQLAITVDGKAASSLSYVESQGATLCVLQSMYDSVFEEGSLGDADLLDDLLRACANPKPLSHSETETLVSRIDAAVNERKVAMRHLRVLKALARYCCRHYFVFVEVTGTTERSRITTTRTVTQRNLVRRYRDRVSIALGLEIRDFVLELPTAVEAASYHATLLAPENMYVFEAQLRPRSVETDQLADAIIRPKSDAPSAEVSDTHGLEHIHVYTRDLDGHLPELVEQRKDGQPVNARFLALVLEASFRERPPGVTLVALVLSIFLSALTIAVGHFHDDVFDDLSGVSSIGKGGVTLLFAIPALVAGWLITRINDETLRRISLASLVIIAWFVLNAGLEVLIAGLKGIQKVDTAAGLGFFHIDHIGWSLLTLSCVLNTLVAAFATLSRGLRYSRRIRKGRSSLTFRPKEA